MAAQRVLVTGASGFIGRHLVARLPEHGFQPVTVTDRLEASLQAPPDIPLVIHLAGRAHVAESWADPLGHYAANVLGTARVLEYCRAASARLVHVSSYIHGRADRLPVAEDAPARPTNPYAHSKVLAEACCAFYAQTFGVSVLTVRPFNVYGPGQQRRFLIPALVSQLVDEDCPVVRVDDEVSRRDYLHVDDLVDLLLAALRSAATGPLNAGSGISHSVREVFDLLTEVTGITKPLEATGARRQGAIDDVVADIGRARDVLGWRPTVPFRIGLEQVVRWEQAARAPAVDQGADQRDGAERGKIGRPSAAP